jgi:hypothetical protein
MMKVRFNKFDADQSKLYRKKQALKLKENLELLDSMELFPQKLESSIKSC